MIYTCQITSVRQNANTGGIIIINRPHTNRWLSEIYVLHLKVCQHERFFKFKKNTLTNYNEFQWAQQKDIFDNASQSLDITNNNSVFFKMPICSYEVMSVFWPLNPVERTSGILIILIIRFT